jgi:twitching motility two-component system response regulator PilH
MPNSIKTCNLLAQESLCFQAASLIEKDMFLLQRQGDRVMAIKKILIVDDSLTARHFLQDVLSKAGYEVIAAETGEDAVLKAKSDMPDLVLMDVVMPGMNGFQATRAITKDDATKHIPVLIVTSKDMETDRIWGIRQGATAFLSKPIEAAELLAKISELDAAAA